MSLALESLLELRALLDSLQTACDNRFSSGAVSLLNKEVIARGGVRSGSSARIELFEKAGRVSNEELSGSSISDCPLNVPVNAESKASRTNFSDI
jgi:hypothetical protein